jgi:amino acid transporter
MSSVTHQSGLRRGRLNAVHLLFFTVSASAPMTVLAGGVIATYAVTGSIGVPLSFPLLALALGLFVVGYAAMSRYVSNAGAFYAYLAQGLGRAWGVSASFVALVAYNTIQIGLYGLFGAVFGGWMSEKFGVDAKWWVWAFAALVVIGLLGVLRVDLNARVLAFLLVFEVLAVITFDVGTLGNPAEGSLSTAGFRWDDLFGAAAAGGIFAFGIAAFIGFESGAIYSEEVKDQRRTVARATYGALAITGVLYAVSAWALLMGDGPSKLVDDIRSDPSGGPGVVFGLIGAHWPSWVADGANILFITSVFAAMLSFHNGVARYLFALGRERVMPPSLGRTGVGSGAPIAGSLIQSFLAIVIVAVFAGLGRNPITELFTWLSYVAAVGVLLLMIGTSVAVIGFFSSRETDENAWQRLIAPILGTLALGVIEYYVITEAASLLGQSAVDYPSLKWILPGLIGIAAVLGLIWGLILRSAKPDIYEGIGRGAVGTPMEHSGQPHAHVGV